MTIGLPCPAPSNRLGSNGNGVLSGVNWRGGETMGLAALAI